jgi:hypothetical protein
MKMVGSRRLELRTSCVSSRRSNQLSYEPDLFLLPRLKIPLELASYGQCFLPIC